MRRGVKRACGIADNRGIRRDVTHHHGTKSDQCASADHDILLHGRSCADIGVTADLREAADDGARRNERIVRDLAVVAEDRADAEVHVPADASAVSS